MSPTVEVRQGGAGGGSAPETPEQVFTPKQDRHGSRSLDEVRPPLPEIPVILSMCETGSAPGAAGAQALPGRAAPALPAGVYIIACTCTHAREENFSTTPPTDIAFVCTNKLPTHPCVQEGEYDAASVASMPAQSPTGHIAAQTQDQGAAVVARAPILEDEDDGEAHHRWPDGTEYFGEWHGGQPNGRGIFVWPSGKHCSPPQRSLWITQEGNRFLVPAVPRVSSNPCPLKQMLKRW